MNVLRLEVFALAVACLALAQPPGDVQAVAGPPSDALPPGALLRLEMVPSGGRASKFPDYPARVEFVAFGPDGKTVISANRDDLVRHWDLAAGKELARWRDRNSALWAVTLSPDGRTVVMGNGPNGELSAWEPAQAKQLPAFPGRHAAAWALAFSPDGKLLASGGSEFEKGLVCVWDWPGGTKRQQFRLTLGRIEALAFSPDSTVLACAAAGGARLWDVKSGRELRTLAASAPCAVAFSPDGKLLATPHSNESGPITLWDTATGKAISRLTPHVTDGRYGWTAALVFSTDGRTLASVGGDRCLRLWDVAGGKERCVFRGHSEPVLSVAFAPDGQRLATGGGDRTILLWDVWGLALPSATELARGGPRAWWRALAGEAGEPTRGSRKQAKRDPPPFAREDLRQAHHAVGLLVRSPKQAVPWLREWLQPATPERLRRLIADLDAGSFLVRERAAHELEHFGQSILPELRKHLQSEPPLEVRRRVEQVIGRLEKAAPFSLSAATPRAIEALEHIGTAEARELLDTLGQTAPEARHREEARAALERLRLRRAP